MRKWLSKVVAGVLACSSVLSITACNFGGGNTSSGGLNFSEYLENSGSMNVSGSGENSGNGGAEKVIDLNKTQLLVQNYTAGFGDEWLYDLENRFEAAYANKSYEDGKMGVQVWHQGAMKQYTPQDVIAGAPDIYFMEGDSYYALTKTEGALEDLTNIMVNPNPDDNGKTILSKLTAQQKAFYGKTDTDGDAKYYAMPHYEGGWGLIYNKELFDAKNYYFADVAVGEQCRLIENANETKGKGPDGKAGTSDDGLPRTYEEFFFLCDEIVARDDYPICWSGQYREHYLTALLNTLVAEYCGLEQMELNLTFEGEAEELVVFDEQGQVVYENGKIKTERVAVTTANGYDVARQAGKYYALEFLDRLMTTDGYCNTKNAFNSTHSHTAAQENFLKGGTTLSSEKAYAMLLDGPWWEAEANSVFNLMGSKKPEYAKQNRDFAWMPLPKATEEKVGSKNIYIDTLSALTCVKAGLGPRKEAALDFVRFSATDESLVKFTQITGALKSFNYTLDADQQSSLSNFAKSVINYKANSDLFVMNSGNPFYVANESQFKMTKYYPGGSYSNPVAAFNDEAMSGEEYFEAMVKYWSSTKIWG